jgi:hypothetical protein
LWILTLREDRDSGEGRSARGQVRLV